MHAWKSSKASLSGQVRGAGADCQPESSKNAVFLRFPALMVRLLGQPALHVDGGHAASAGGGRRLAIVAVGDVPSGEDTGHAGIRPERNCQYDISLGIHLELSAEEIGI